MCKLIRGFDVRIGLGSMLLESRVGRCHTRIAICCTTRANLFKSHNAMGRSTPVWGVIERPSSQFNVDHYSQYSVMVVDAIYTTPGPPQPEKERIDAQSVPHDTDRARLGVLGLRTLATELSVVFIQRTYTARLIHSHLFPQPPQALPTPFFPPCSNSPPSHDTHTHSRAWQAYPPARTRRSSLLYQPTDITKRLGITCTRFGRCCRWTCEVLGNTWGGGIGLGAMGSDLESPWSGVNGADREKGAHLSQPRKVRHRWHTTQPVGALGWVIRPYFHTHRETNLFPRTLLQCQLRAFVTANKALMNPCFVYMLYVSTTLANKSYCRRGQRVTSRPWKTGPLFITVVLVHQTQFSLTIRR